MNADRLAVILLSLLIVAGGVLQSTNIIVALVFDYTNGFHDAANAIATPTTAHGARLIKRASLSNITSLTPSHFPSLSPAFQTTPRTTRGTRSRTS